MTTIREYIEDQNISEPILQWYNDHKGSIPLCCYEMRKTVRGWLIRCHWLQLQDDTGAGWCTEEEFKEKCLECQAIIEKKLYGN